MMEQPELNAIRHAAFGVAGYAELTAEQLAGITILLNTAPFDWSMETDAAVTAVVAARALNAAQAKAIEQGADPDLLGAITAQDVTDALAL